MKKTVKASELSKLRMAAGNEKKYDTVIHNGEVKDWVFIEVANVFLYSTRCIWSRKLLTT